MCQKKGTAGKVVEAVGGTLRSPLKNGSRIHDYFGRCHHMEEEGRGVGNFSRGQRTQ